MTLSRSCSGIRTLLPAVIAAFLFPAAGLLAAPAGQLAMVRGEVTVNGKPATDGMPVEVGNIIVTGMGKCSVLLNREHVIHLDTDTELKLTEAHFGSDSETTQVDLAYGRARMLVKSQAGRIRVFNVRTRGATMGVRGTHILVDSPRDPSVPQSFVTVEGQAAVRLAGAGRNPIQLGANESVTSAGDSGGGGPSPQVQKVPAKEVAAIAAQVAPPPAELRTSNDVRQFPNRAGPPPSDRFGLQPAMPPVPRPLPLDPIADAIAGVKVISGFRIYTGAP